MSARAFAGRPGRASRRPAAGTCRIGPARVPGPEPCLARARALGEVARGFPPAAAEATQPVTHSYSLTRSGRPPVGALQRNPGPTAMAFLISRTWPRSSGGALGTRARTAGRGQNRFIERSEATLARPSAQVGEKGLSRSGAQAGTTRQTGHDLALHTVRAFLAPARQARRAPALPRPGVRQPAAARRVRHRLRSRLRSRRTATARWRTGRFDGSGRAEDAKQEPDDREGDQDESVGAAAVAGGEFPAVDRARQQVLTGVEPVPQPRRPGHQRDRAGAEDGDDQGADSGREDSRHGALPDPGLVDLVRVARSEVASSG